MKDGRIYSIGYQRLTYTELEAAMAALHATIVDVRSVPNARNPLWRRGRLESVFGGRYLWAGDRLGGRGAGPTDEGLDWLRFRDRPVILMCQEEAPGDCHRHHRIAMPLLQHDKDPIEVRHIFRDVVFTASELDKEIRTGEPYAFEDAEWALEVAS